MTLRFLNPSHEAQAQAFAPAPRPASLAGATVGFISNGKEGTRVSSPILKPCFGSTLA